MTGGGAVGGVTGDPDDGSVGAGADQGRRLAEVVVTRLTAAGQTLGVAESLTGGLLVARVVDVPGASAVLRGGVVAYATDLKHRLLGVDPDLLADRGSVDAEVAAQMAAGARARLGADWGLSTTGVAGPDTHDGRVPGTVAVGLAGPGVTRVRELLLAGNRSQIRAGAVTAALEQLLFAMGEEEG